MEPGKDFQQITNEYAARCIESMRDDLDALQHAQECKKKRCKRGSETESFTRSDGVTGEQLIHECPEAWHDEDCALQHIMESPLSIEVRSDWHLPGEESEIVEYNILLGTGGPASRIVGDLDCGQPISAIFQYQDWFKPWTDAQIDSEQEETLLEYTRCFYFAEG
jgi:hypothetical protein